MSNLSVLSQSSHDPIEEILNMYNDTDFPVLDFRQEAIIISTVILVICLFGLVGNGTVIWLLGFHIQRNAFTTYILNLALADFGALICSALRAIGTIQEDITGVFLLAVYSILNFMYSAGQLLLMTISIDRCVVVLFPIWHRCHRPPKLSTIIWVLIWVLSFMICGSNMLLLLMGYSPLVPVIVNVLLCYPLMAISTVTLFVKVRNNQHNRSRSKSLTVILLSLLFFLIFGFPVNVNEVLTYCYFLAGIEPNRLFHLSFDYSEYDFAELIIILKHYYIMNIFDSLAYLCIAANSSVNPVLYFLARREKTVLHGVSRLKVTLQRLFHDMEDCREDEEAQDQTHLSSF